MDKKFNYLLLSPTGEAIVCKNLAIEARRILKERYKCNRSCDDPIKILLNYGWMAYHDDSDLGEGSNLEGWMIHERRKPVTKFKKYGIIPTQVQLDKIRELFDREFDASWVSWNASDLS